MEPVDSLHKFHVARLVVGRQQEKFKMKENGHNSADRGELGSVTVKRGLAQMLKGGVIMDVVTPEHARIAEEAGAVAVMALERVPADIRVSGGVARMSDPGLIREIMATVSIPVMAKVRIGHFVEAQILESLGVDYIDESEVLTPADEAYHINKHDFKIPFVCGCRNLGEALRRIGEGAAMMRTNLQERRPGAAGQGHRRGHDPLSQRRDFGPRQREPGRADGRHRRPHAGPGAAVGGSRLVGIIRRLGRFKNLTQRSLSAQSSPRRIFALRP